MEFEFFDPDSQVEITFRDLPHWFQPGATYFVTFRAADSLPEAAIEKLEAKRREWLSARGIDTNIPAWKSALEKLPRMSQVEYHRMFNREFQSMLDSGCGACVLRRPEAARIVSDAILHFNGARYHVSDFVVMPNHVHVLFGLIGHHRLSDVCYSWKRFTATQINRLIGTRGHFWQGESFDHLVRSEEQLAFFRGYIASNPIVAKLGPNESLLYQHAPEASMPT